MVEIVNDCQLVQVFKDLKRFECPTGGCDKVKFVYDFFPKEQYAPEYISVHKARERDFLPAIDLVAS